MMTKKMAKNVYRTKHYIVIQELTINKDSDLSLMVLSEDAYYQRTKARDKKYNKFYGNRKYIDGKRVHATVYKRRYFK